MEVARPVVEPTGRCENNITPGLTAADLKLTSEHYAALTFKQPMFPLLARTRHWANGLLFSVLLQSLASGLSAPGVSCPCELDTTGCPGDRDSSCKTGDLQGSNRKHFNNLPCVGANLSGSDQIRIRTRHRPVSGPYKVRSTFLLCFLPVRFLIRSC